ncbi:EscU/YscU/HrcU family type III secretion system export apparatus switch protein, partial [Salmonella enterica]|nr:EscU/YscU/HrcU family type III secretion system export apparatus switch protein [Salmonella enterica]
MSTEKTLPPTPKKLREAREEGQVAKSNELAAGVQLAVILLYLYTFGNDIWKDLSEILLLTFDQFEQPLPTAFSAFFSALCSFIFKDLAFMFLILFFASIASYIGQIGFLFSSKSLIPKINKLDVVKN